MSHPHHRGLLRTRNGHEHNKVSFIELFFDLVFVFAVTQLSHSLIAHFSLEGAFQTLLLMMAVWWVWIYTSWVTNWLDPEKIPVRLLLVALMLLGLVLSASIPKAFDTRGLAFAGAYVAMQVGRSLFCIWAMRGDQSLVCNFWRISVWLGVSGVLWIAGGLSEGEARLYWWMGALAIEYLGPSQGFFVPGLGRSTTQDWNVEGGHLAERCGLFIIIALGESILVTGATFSTLEWTASVVGAFVASFAGSLALWWLYFDFSADAGTRTITHSGDPGRLARRIYTYLHLFMVAGVILSAVGDEFVLAHPDGHMTLPVAVAVLGGPAIYLFGNALFRQSYAGTLPLSPLLGIGALLVLLALAHGFTPCGLSVASTVVVLAVAAWEARGRKRCPEASLEKL